MRVPAHMYWILLLDPRHRRLAALVLTLALVLLSACQNNGTGGGGVPGY